MRLQCRFYTDYPGGLCGHAKSEVNLRLETEKALGAMKEENKNLLFKLIVEERERKST